VEQRRLQAPEKPFLDRSTRRQQQQLRDTGLRGAKLKAVAGPHGEQEVKFRGITQQRGSLEEESQRKQCN